MKIVITGTSRGIGLELVRCALGAGHEVLAIAREPAKATELSALAREQAGKLHIVAADLTQARATATISASLRPWDAVDVLVNNAGILRDTATREDFLASFLVNSIAPFEVTQALLPWLRRSTHPRVLHVTSKMGSIAVNTSGGHYAYRASKAALNMINASLARDHAWLTCVLVHPGWVRTDMGGPEAPVAPRESAAGIWRLAESLGRESSGQFLDFQGALLPW